MNLIRVGSFVLAAIAVTTTSFVPNVWAEGNLLGSNSNNEVNQFRGHHHLRADKNLGAGKWNEKLNLDESQQEQMNTIQAKYQDQFQTLREDLRSQRDKLNQMMEDDESEENLRSQHQNVTTVEQKIRDLRFEAVLEMRKVLTAEQRQQWSQLRENSRGQWQKKQQ